MDTNSFEKDIIEYEEWFKINDKIYKSELQAIKVLLPQSGRGLEVGVGSGLFASVLGIKEGIDPSEAMVKASQDKGLKVVKAHAEDIPFTENSFDYILMVTVDCFLNQVLKSFSEINRVLKPGGILLVAFLDRSTELGKIYEKNKYSSESYKDANFHSSDEMIDILEKSGFTIQEKRQTVYSLENKLQEVKNGTGEGLFAVLKAKK